LLLLLGFGSALGQSYSIGWYTIDGGGGTSSGGAYTVSGTIGQPDAGQMSGGNYTIVGGFWAVVAAVQTINAPFLNVLHSATNSVVVYWLLPDTGFVLQSTTSLAAPVTWTDIPGPYSTDGTHDYYTASPPTSNNYYRLHHP
jgi:hypothetical protein